MISWLCLWNVSGCCIPDFARSEKLKCGNPRSVSASFTPRLLNMKSCWWLFAAVNFYEKNHRVLSAAGRITFKNDARHRRIKGAQKTKKKKLKKVECSKRFLMVFGSYVQNVKNFRMPVWSVLLKNYKKEDSLIFAGFTNCRGRSSILQWTIAFLYAGAYEPTSEMKCNCISSLN